MISTIIGLIVALAIVGIAYIILKWFIGTVSLPAPLIQIVNIIFGVVAVVIILKFLLKLL